MIMMIMFNLLVLGLIVGAVTFTTSTTSIFGWFRELVSKIQPKIEELIHCPWCSGFWLSLLMVGTADLPWIHVFKVPLLNLLCTTFAVLAIAGPLHYVLLRAYKPVAEAMSMRHREKIMALREQKKQES